MEIGEYRVQLDVDTKTYYVFDPLRADPNDPASPRVFSVTVEAAEALRPFQPRCGSGWHLALAVYLRHLLEHNEYGAIKPTGVKNFSSASSGRIR